jgi:hypothetical protein
MQDFDSTFMGCIEKFATHPNPPLWQPYLISLYACSKEDSWLFHDFLGFSELSLLSDFIAHILQAFDLLHFLGEGNLQCAPNDVIGYRSWVIKTDKGIYGKRSPASYPHRRHLIF